MDRGSKFYLELKKEAVVNAVNVRHSPDGTNRLIVHFSDWRRLRVAAAWFLKLKKMLLHMTRKKRESETSDTSVQNATAP